MRIPNGRRARKTEPRASAENTRPLGATWLLASRWRVPVALSAVAAGAVLAAPAVASASPLPSPVTGHVYLDDNTAGTNTIAAFDRHADGTLTPLPGSPFSAGGAGTGAGLASEGAVQIADGGRFLLAVDAGSNQVSVLRDRAGRVAAPRERGVLRRGAAGQHRGARQPGLRRQRLPGRQQLHRLPPRSVRHPDSGARVDGRPARRRPARRRAVQRHRHQADRHAGGHLADRQLHRGTGRAADGGPGLAVHRPGSGPVRQPVPADQPRPAVRVQRPQRHRAGHGLGVHRLARRSAHPDRGAPRSPTSRRRRAGSRSARTAATCSR